MAKKKQKKKKKMPEQVQRPKDFLDTQGLVPISTVLVAAGAKGGAE